MNFRWLSLVLLTLMMVTASCQDVSLPPDEEPAAQLPSPATPTATIRLTSTIPDPTETLSITSTEQAPDPATGFPEIDGIISPGEWDHAHVSLRTFSDDSELFIIQNFSTVYLAIRSSTPEMIAANVFLQYGDRIKILHTSAALGTAIYQKDDTAWQQIQDFSWCCRRTGNGDAVRSERAAFLDKEGWVAAISPTGTPNELEFQIELEGESVQLAVNILRSSNPDEKVVFPVGLEDGCSIPTPGGLPAEMYFSPDQWLQILVDS